LTDFEYSKIANFRLILVDHNRPAGGILSYLDRVDEIYDHHKDETDAIYKHKIGYKVIDMVGSCTTLIVDEYLKRNIKIDSVTAKTLLGVILIDTVNFDTTAKRATKKR